MPNHFFPCEIINFMESGSFSPVSALNLKEEDATFFILFQLSIGFQRTHDVPAILSASQYIFLLGHLLPVENYVRSPQEHSEEQHVGSCLDFVFDFQFASSICVHRQRIDLLHRFQRIQIRTTGKKQNIKSRGAHYHKHFRQIELIETCFGNVLQGLSDSLWLPFSLPLVNLSII